ncbi:MAG TPA: hypothetical protein VKD90_04675, partial [Gemmataceae bacterium]|nr:hypothetical protein [Gemmataceae bacterium]
MQSIHRVWRSRRRSLRLEPLESRRAPATLVSPFQVTYQDADGDRVAVTLSKPLLTPDNVDGVLQFDVGRVDGDNTTRQQLRAIDVRALEFHIPGLSITVMATRGPATGGDGRAPVGRINAGDQELGVVTIDGDLGQLDGGGDPANIPRLRGLAVHSLGRFGLATGAVQQVVTVRGPVAFIRVATDVTGVAIHVGNGNFGGPAGRVGSVFVGGSLIGGAADDSGGLSTEGPLGPIIIRGDLIGGPGFWSGRIDTFARLAAITVGGSVVGGPALESGQIAATAGMGPVVIRGDVVGGAGELSGTVFSYGSGSVSRVAVGGSVRGGTGRASGSVLVFTGVGVVHVGGNLVGGSAAASAGLTDAGMIEAGRITRLTIGGSLIAGTNGTADPFQCNGAIRVR